jgi:CHAD domain-containing protein
MSKWVEIDVANRPAAEVAAEIVRLRMQAVSLQLAAKSSDREQVHQLRVSCRRAGAALRAFRPLAGGKSKRLRRWLQRLRQAAGPARDLDVLLERITAEPEARPDHAYLVARLQQQRLRAQGPLVAIAAEALSGGLEKSVRRCLRRLGASSSSPSPPSLPFGPFAHQALRTASQVMFTRAALQQPTIAQLHAMRIAAKRLRYSIEIFQGAFPTTLRTEVYPLVESIQARLGTLNDHATAQRLFQRWLADLPANQRAAQLARRIEEEYEASCAAAHAFLQWWTPQRAAELESYLSVLIHD